MKLVIEALRYGDIKPWVYNYTAYENCITEQGYRLSSVIYALGLSSTPIDSQRQQQLPQQAHPAVIPSADRSCVSHRSNSCPHAARDGSGQDEKGLH